MKRFAVIQNNIVINVIIADTKEIAEEATGLTCIESTDENSAYIGLKYENGVFEKPVSTNTEH
jgi:hypothetical protein